MLPHNINIKVKDNHSRLGQSCRVCDTTAEHDCCVAEMTNLSSSRFNTTIAVFDKSSNTLTHQSWGHLDPENRMNKAMEFQNIVMTHADKDTKHVTVDIEPSVINRRIEKKQGIN